MDVKFQALLPIDCLPSIISELEVYQKKKNLSLMKYSFIEFLELQKSLASVEWKYHYIKRSLLKYLEFVDKWKLIAVASYLAFADKYLDQIPKFTGLSKSSNESESRESMAQKHGEFAFS